MLGLTGSIGMGKTTAARMLGRMGVPVCDSDATVHRLFSAGGAAVSAIAATFPDVVTGATVGGSVAGTVDRAIDRRRLGAAVFGDPAALARLEAIVHPLVRSEQNRFLARAAACGSSVAVLDIPLLFETGAERRVDAVIVVSAPAFVQRQRVLRRSGMTPQRLAAILVRQTPDAEKRRRADWVVPTGLGRAVTWRALSRILSDVRRRHGRHWPPRGYPAG